MRGNMDSKSSTFIGTTGFKKIEGGDVVWVLPITCILSVEAENRLSWDHCGEYTCVDMLCVSSELMS